MSARVGVVLLGLALQPAALLAQRQSELIRMADSLIPYVEGASGLTFLRPPLRRAVWITS
jgi:hypothetical protein